MHRRRTRATLLAAACVSVATGLATVGAIAAGLPAAATPTPNDVGLYGSADPTYDGVYRQSLAITGLVAAGKSPDPAAVSWLLAQQCTDGAFTAYRADPSVACTPAKEDENATAAAVIALTAAGKPTASAVAALKRFQLPDGGFYDNTAFGPAASDANSTGLALSALVAAGVDPATVLTGGKSGADYLRTLQLPCTAPTGAGGYDFQGETTLTANDYATAQATLGQLAKTWIVVPAPLAATVPACVPATDTATSSADAVAYLAGRLTATSGAIPSSVGSGIDWTSTANAVLALAAAGQGSAAAAAGLDALRANVTSYDRSNGVYAPGPLGTLLLVAHATGSDANSFGGVDLAAALASTVRTAASSSPAPTPTPSAPPAASSNGPTLPMTGGRDDASLAAVGLGLVAFGIAFLTAARRRRAAGGETS